MAERRGVLLINQLEPGSSGDHRRPSRLQCYFKKGNELHSTHQLRTASSGAEWEQPYSIRTSMGDRQLSAGLYGLDSGSNTYPIFVLLVTGSKHDWMTQGHLYDGDIKVNTAHTTDHPSSRTWRNSVLTPALYTKKIYPYDQWLYAPLESSLQVLTRRKTDAYWEPLDSFDLGMEADSVASCLNRQGVWLFISVDDSDILKTFFRFHGEDRFREIGVADIGGKCVGAASSWQGNPRVIVAKRPKIYECWWDGQRLTDPTAIVNVGSSLDSINVSVAYQREMDTPEGYRPETLTLAYASQTDGEILSSVWTSNTGSWKEGPPIVVPD